MRLVAILTTLVLVLSSLADGQDTLLINYQGRLIDDGGNPVSGTPSITFTVYDGGGLPKWTETHSAVPVDGGLFSVILGSVTAMPDSVFNGEDRYLGITIGTDSELSPRTLFTSAPSAAYAKRMAGDLTTLPGLMVLNNPFGDSAVSISSGLVRGGLVTTIKMIEPGDDGSPIMEMKADGGTNSFTYRIIEPGDDGTPDFELLADGVNRTVTWRLAHPPKEPAAEIISDGIANTINFRLVHPPEKSLIAMSSNGDGGASIYMFDPQPEPPGVMFDLSVNPTTGATMDFFDQAGHVMGVEPSPFNSGFAIKLFNPQLDPPSALAEMTSFYGMDGAHGRLAVYDPGASLESELTPGNLRLQFRTGPMDGPALFLNADQMTARIGIGTAAPEFSLDMKSFGTGDGMRVNSSDGSQLFRIRENSDGSCETEISDLNGATKVMIRAAGATYFTGGNVGIGVSSPVNILQVQQGSATDPIADAWTTYSSRRWKDNIRPIEGALGMVERLRGVSFDWLIANKRDIGMIAEEVGEIVPEVVTYEENGVDARSIDYNRLTALLVEAIKELKRENEDLRRRLEAIENR